MLEGAGGQGHCELKGSQALAGPQVAKGEELTRVFIPVCRG